MYISAWPRQHLLQRLNNGRWIEILLERFSLHLLQRLNGERWIEKILLLAFLSSSLCNSFSISERLLKYLLQRLNDGWWIEIFLLALLTLQEFLYQRAIAYVPASAIERWTVDRELIACLRALLTLQQFLHQRAIA